MYIYFIVIHYIYTFFFNILSLKTLRVPECSIYYTLRKIAQMTTVKGINTVYVKYIQLLNIWYLLKMRFWWIYTYINKNSNAQIFFRIRSNRGWTNDNAATIIKRQCLVTATHPKLLPSDLYAMLDILEIGIFLIFLGLPRPLLGSSSPSMMIVTNSLCLSRWPINFTLPFSRGILINFLLSLIRWIQLVLF